MKKLKQLLSCLFFLAAAFGVGWATYHFASPSSAAEEGSGHAGHDHHQAAGHEDHLRHPAGEEEVHSAHDHESDGHAGENGHPGHGHEGDRHVEEDGFFADLEETSHPVQEDGHAQEAHEPGRESDPHAGHDHAGHGHGGGDGGICPEHKIPEAEDALCQSSRVGELRVGQGMKVRLAAPDLAARVGIGAANPAAAENAGAAWPGQLVFNRDRLAALSALAPGVIKKVGGKLGDRVEEGEILAEIASPAVAGLHSELAAAESRRELAEAVFQREKDLLAKGVTSRQEYQQSEAELRQAESAVARARQQVQDYGLSGGSGSTLPVRAPFAGTILERSAVEGENVAPETVLFTLADLSTLWIEVSVPEENLLEVQPGLEVNASFPVLPGRVFGGKIFWVAPALDPKTRMLKALAAVDNREGLLKSGLFGEVSPANRLQTGAVAVPADALQSVDGKPFVFLSLADDLYELRRVIPGRKANGSVIIREGLNLDDKVVTALAFALKSEVLRARLGASCADH